MSQNKTIGERIKEARTAFGMSQKEFAEKAGLSGSSISRIEKGEIIPSAKTAKQLCIAHNIRRDWLEEGTGPMSAPPPDENEEAVMAAFDKDDENKKALLSAVAKCNSEAVVSITKLFFDFITEPKNHALIEVFHIGALSAGKNEKGVSANDVLWWNASTITDEFKERMVKKYSLKNPFSIDEILEVMRHEEKS